MFFCLGWLVNHGATYLLLAKVHLREFFSEVIQSVVEKISSLIDTGNAFRGRCLINSETELSF